MSQFTVEIEADETAKSLAKIICSRQSWMVRNYNDDGALFTDWVESEVRLKKMIERELLK